MECGGLTGGREAGEEERGRMKEECDGGGGRVSKDSKSGTEEKKNEWRGRTNVNEE